MASIAAVSAPSGPAFEIKGTIAPVSVLCLRSIDVDQIERELRARVDAAPQLFTNAPIVIDVADVAGPLPLTALVERVRQCKLLPIGVAHLPADQLTLAASAGLAIMQLGFGRSRGARASSPEPVAPTPPPARTVEARPEPPRAREATLTITQPVRGGQVTYATGGDLVVLAPVNPGAQVIADGHIHIYGRLRGRALAGARGLTTARVFCHSLEAELIAIAGEFLTADEIPAKLRGKPAQIFLEQGTVRILPL
jgi:septum site-determining protein MinC